MQKKVILLILLILLLSCLGLSAQIVRGTVTDGRGNPLTSAVATLQDRGGKTLDKRVCNDKGEFDFKLPADNDSLQVCITFIGFEPLTVTVPKGGEQLDLGNLKMVESSTELGAVTVKAEAGPDRTYYFPNKAMKERSADGYELINKLMLPGIKVNAMKESVSTVNDGSVLILINDREATREKMLSLRPKNVTKVEFIDMPGAEYGNRNAEKVIKITTKAAPDGISGGLNLNDALTILRGFNSGYLYYNRGRSEFSFDANYFHSYTNSSKNIIDEKTAYAFDSGPHDLARNGLKSKCWINQKHVGMSYNYTQPQKDILEMGISYFDYNKPTDDNWSIASETERDNYWSKSRYAIGNKLVTGYLFYKHYFSENNSIYANVAYTNLRSTYGYYTKNYSDEAMSNMTKQYAYDERGISNTWNSSIFHYVAVGKVGISSGASYFHGHLNNDYTGGNKVNNKLDNDNLYIYSQAGGSIGKLSLLAGVGVTYQHDKQGDVSISKWTLRPFVNTSLNLGKVLLRYNFSMFPNSPSLGSKADNIQQTNEHEYRQGNPNLTSYRTYYNQMITSWQSGRFSVYNTTTFNYSDKPIMADVLHTIINGNEAMITTIFNHKSALFASDYLWIQTKIIPDMLTAQGGVFFAHYKSVGNDYKHELNNLRFDFRTNLELKKWEFQFDWTSHSRSLSGETMTISHSSVNLSAVYRIGNLRIGLYGSNLFRSSPLITDYRTLNRNMQRMFKLRLHSMGNEISMSVSWTFEKGRKRQNERGNVNTGGSEDGIMQAN